MTFTTKKRSGTTLNRHNMLSPQENLRVQKFLKAAVYNNITFPHITDDGEIDKEKPRINIIDFVGMSQAEQAAFLDRLELRAPTRAEKAVGSPEEHVFENAFYRLTYSNAVSTLELISRNHQKP